MMKASQGYMICLEHQFAILFELLGQYNQQSKYFLYKIMLKFYVQRLPHLFPTPCLCAAEKINTMTPFLKNKW